MTEFKTESSPARWNYWPIVVAVILASAFATYVNWNVPTFSDETYQFNQTRLIMQGRFSEVRNTMPPGYHSTMALVAKVLGVESVNGMRLISSALGLLVVIASAGIAFTLADRNPGLRVLQVFFLPLLFPYIFLIFTDALSLAVLLFAIWAALKRVHWLSGVLAIASMMVRQNNVVWVAFIVGMIHVEQFGFALGREALMTTLRRTWIHALGLLAFAVFVVVNRGVSMAAQVDHPSGKFSPDNVFASLFVVSVLFLPQVVAAWRRVYRLLRLGPLPWFLLATVFVIYGLTFEYGHPLHHWMKMPLNLVLDVMSEDRYRKTILFVPIAVAILYLMVIRMRHRSFYLIFPAAGLFLMPSWLVTARYFMIPFALLHLFREPEEDWAEWLSFLVSVLLALSITWTYQGS